MMGTDAQIAVKLMGTLPRLLKWSEDENVIEVETGAKVVDLMAVLNVSSPLVVIPVVNGAVQRGDYELHDGDRVELMPAVTGG